MCNYLRRYPVIPPDGIVSEVYHAQKWRRDVDRHTLSPMYDAGDRHYYIDELACLNDGSFIIPVRWLEDSKGKIFADAYQVVFHDHVRSYDITYDIFLLIMILPACYDCQCDRRHHHSSQCVRFTA